eukprot:CAMPEP_0206435960 /NCGR_PEP_ID=MMETSP0324_2-20121206/10208_1 /ASSEMBLY_ACC=CAM_ASM_000836 /TAXON_ID=2866 /ORGANISM="Crypthecodinium cohnii, Strain Seligo" /LENGTH=204 /DNA_ID=CAMNT_0053903053 /DNA_START=130 /DNA_END=744 /DNA_ORIENTATION=+
MAGISSDVDSELLTTFNECGVIKDSTPGLSDAGPCWSFVTSQSTSFGDVETVDVEMLHQLVLLSDGRAMLKKSYQTETYGQNPFDGNRKWEMAEGTYTLEDGGKVCKLAWKAHAEAEQKGYKEVREPAAVAADAWTSKGVDGDSGPAIWIGPNPTVNLQELCQGYESQMKRNAERSPEMIGLTEDILEGLGFSKDHLSFYIYKS